MIYNKERPHRFDDIKGQSLVVENIRNQSIRNEFFPVFVLCGQFGSGKTTMARIIAMAANCKHKDQKGNPCGTCISCRAVLAHDPDGILELDGASNNGVEDVRRLISLAGTHSLYGKKIIVIDEAHMLSKSAFNALLITLENPPEECIFILCTTEKDALPDTVLSRAPVYVFGKIPDVVIRDHLLEVASRNSILISSDAAGTLARYANGAMRNALQLLELLSLQRSEKEEITEQDVVETLGLSSIEQRYLVLDAILNGEMKIIYHGLKRMEQEGIELRTFLTDLLSMATDLLLYHCGDTIVGSTYYLSCLEAMRSYDDEMTGKLCRVLSKLSAIPFKQLSISRVIVDILAEFPPSLEEQALLSEKQKETEAEKPVSVSQDDLFESTESSPFSEENVVPKEEIEVPTNPFSGGSFGFSMSFLGMSTKKVSDQNKISFSAGKQKSTCLENDEKTDACVENKENGNLSFDTDQTETPLDKTVEPDNQKENTSMDEGKEISWQEMVAHGLMSENVSVTTKSEDAIKNELMELEAENQERLASIQTDESVAGEDESNYPRTRADLINAQKELEGLLKNPGFKILYDRARVVIDDNQIYLVYHERPVKIASQAFTALKNGVHSVMEGEIK